jgi:hypothetical protein
LTGIGKNSMELHFALSSFAKKKVGIFGSSSSIEVQGEFDYS